jgi:hypothetical protein
MAGKPRRPAGARRLSAPARRRRARRRFWEFFISNVRNPKTRRGPSTRRKVALSPLQMQHECAHLHRRPQMVIGVTHIQPIAALIAGVLILVMPRLLNYIVAIYLIVVGILGLGFLK